VLFCLRAAGVLQPCLRYLVNSLREFFELARATARIALREKANPFAQQAQAAVVSLSSVRVVTERACGLPLRWRRREHSAATMPTIGGKCPSSGITMDEAEYLSGLIGEIYDAALDASRWSDVLGKAGHFVGGPVASIFAKSPTSLTGTVYYHSSGDRSGRDPSYRQLYLDKYIKLDPMTTAQYFSDVGQPMAVADVMPYQEFLETRFYKEWVQPQGIVDAVTAVLDKSVTSAALFGVFRYQSDGIVDDEARRRMRLIVPHIRRAVLVGRLIDLKAADAASLADTLDGLSAAMCVVDSVGRIVHANTACHVLLDAGDVVSAAGGRIVADDPKIDQIFRELFAAAGSGDAAIGTQGIALPLRAQDGSNYAAHILPLTSGARRLAGMAYSATAALFICKVATETRSPPEIIARAYHLTPTELRVLLAIVEVGGVPETAVALGVAESTIKTHLGNLFVKTSTGRQADLVKIVAGFATPLIG
jgi:DNA-binding CsgD family transcriptional regulator